MPEGLEVFILAIALKELGYVCFSKGKHVILKDPYSGEWFDYSFGLMGKVHIDEKNLTLHKIKHPKIVSGDKKLLKDEKELDSTLGLDWMTADKDQLETVVRSWLTKKRQIAALLLDQKEICGIGVAWGSEILHVAKIHPTTKTNLLQFLDLIDNLVSAIITIRDKFKKIYLETMPQNNKKFVNEWFLNLYKARENDMNVYKKGSCVRVSGREFWI
jgi:formamidopyrimidine-DNA glycosylase